MTNLKEFITPAQLSSLSSSRLISITAMIDGMPTTGETDGKGNDAPVTLHYSIANCHWFITEKDSVEGEPQYQAFGFADMGFPELGYISIDELISNNVYLDVYFKPKTLGEVKKEYGY